MSITAETAQEHAKDPAVLCCRAEGGITIEPANLEDPTIFDDLVDSGLLNLDGALKIEQVLGAKLLKTCDSLTPLTKDVLEGYKEEGAAAAEPTSKPEAAPTGATNAAPVAPVAPAPAVAGSQVTLTAGIVKIHIAEGKNIDLEFPAAVVK